MKRILIAIGIFGVILIGGCHWPGVDNTNRHPVYQDPGVSPNSFGCSAKVSALGTHLVSAMSWTNSNGHSGVGTDVIYPEWGSGFSVFADPSVSCATNLPTIAAVTFTCHGTNMPNAIPLVLPKSCSGFVCTNISGDCGGCTFTVSSPIGFDCNIYAPTRK